MGCFVDDLRASGINADQWTAATQDERNDARRRKKGRNVSWQNGPLQGKSGLDYGIQ